MNKDDLLKLIKSQTNQHPLKINLKSDYFSCFENQICNLSLGKKVDKKIEELIKDNGNFSVFKYNQGIAELMLWFLMEKQKTQYDIEIDVNETGKNVDIQANYKGIKYNIEIKSPEYDIRKEGELVGIVSHRSNSDLLQRAEELARLFQNNLSGSEYNSIRTVKPADNKVKDCLESAQIKFNNNSSTECNILFLCTTTNECSKYLNYIFNSESGFFTPNSYIQHKKFDKVKAIVLSNAISLNNRYDEKSWDIANAINLIIRNPYCEYENNSILDNLFSLIPNKTESFVEEYSKFCIKQLKSNEPLIDYLFFTEFFAR